MRPSLLTPGALVALTLLMGLPATTSGAEAVVSNLEGEGIAACVIADSQGFPLAVGSHVRLVVFPGKSAAEIDGLANSGLASVLAQSEMFGSPSSIGAGVAEPGRLEFQAGQALPQPLDGLHLLVANAADPVAAGEFLLLRLPTILPADELTGPGAHTSVHLADAEVVFGSETATGYATASLDAPSGYESWSGSVLGEGYSDEDRLPDADPDGDGRVNLIEYATGASPTDPVLPECLIVARIPGDVMRVVYLRRADDDGIFCRVDYRHALDEGDWDELGSALAVPAAIPFPAPDGCEWVEQALPAGDRGFVRMRVELNP